MSSQNKTELPPPLDLSGWRKLPVVFMVIGAILSVIGLIASPREFGYAWLLSFLFFLTLSLGALFFAIIHHLTDAGWSVATRRICEHIGSLLFPWLAILFIPVILLASKIYPWMTLSPVDDRAVSAKGFLFTLPGFCVASAIFFGIWWVLTARINYWSLRQDVTGDALCTRKMRFHSGWGILAFAATVTVAPILWMNSLEYQWSSTMYGLYMFASCGWIALATIYILTAVLQRQRILTPVLHDNQFYFLGVLFFAFTLLQAYFEFAQYFVVWNGNVPEETYFYLIRENGSWWWVSMALIFGHFFLPFVLLLPAHVKMNFKIMIPICAWAWLMNFADLAFNVLPVLHPHNYPFKWIWLHFGTFAFMAGLLAHVFLKKFRSHPPYPQRDPRVLEAMGIGHEPDEMPDTLPVEGGAQ
ncbi:MAG TPA: hypothetical protein VHG71_10175 [Verrucomicrobiae bacterium]|nr:hypothetical protein [Verrucomicrobiae bacterium]